MKTMLSLAVVFIAASVTQGDIITFSGRDWTTRTGGGNAYGTVPGYVIDDAQTATQTGAWNDAAMMYTILGISVGDVISYDVTSSQELRDLSGAVPGGSDYIGDMWTGFIGGTVASLEDFSYVTELKDVFFTAVDSTYVWTFTSPTTVDLAVTDNLTSTTTTFPATPLATDISGITGFTVASWNTEQDTTLSNFVYTAIPEPASIVLLALGGILLRCKRR